MQRLLQSPEEVETPTSIIKLCLEERKSLVKKLSHKPEV